MKRTRGAFGALSDGDAAGTSELVARRRRQVTVADLEAGFRADTVLAFVAAQGDLAAELSVLADASRYDATHPDEPSLTEEMCAAVAGEDGGLSGVAVAA